MRIILNNIIGKLANLYSLMKYHKRFKINDLISF